MPTPGEENLNPMTDILETNDQKEKRLKHEKELRDLLAQLPKREPANKIG